MRVKLMKTGESEQYVHLMLVVGTRQCGAVLIPKDRWEEFEQEEGFMLEVGQHVVCDLSAVTVKGEITSGESSRGIVSDG